MVQNTSAERDTLGNENIIKALSDVKTNLSFNFIAHPFIETIYPSLSLNIQLILLLVYSLI